MMRRKKRQRLCAETMRELSSEAGKVSPCHVNHRDTDMCGMVHGDDFAFAGTGEFLNKIANHMDGGVQHRGWQSQDRSVRACSGC